MKMMNGQRLLHILVFFWKEVLEFKPDDGIFIVFLRK